MRDAIAVALKDTKASDKAELIWTAYFGGRVIIKSGGTKTVLKAIQGQMLALL